MVCRQSPDRYTTLGRFAALVGVSRQTMYNWRRKHVLAFASFEGPIPGWYDAKPLAAWWAAMQVGRRQDRRQVPVARRERRPRAALGARAAAPLTLKEEQ